MNKSEVLDFINENPVFHLATSLNNRPYVRIMRVIQADENGILFNTKRYKDSFQQLTHNSSVELCFYNEIKDIQIRVSGNAIASEEQELKEKIVTNFPKLQAIIEEHGFSAIVPFILTEWTFTLCTRH